MSRKHGATSLSCSNRKPEPDEPWRYASLGCGSVALDRQRTLLHDKLRVRYSGPGTVSPRSDWAAVVARPPEQGDVVAAADRDAYRSLIRELYPEEVEG